MTRKCWFLTMAIVISGVPWAVASAQIAPEQTPIQAEAETTAVPTPEFAGAGKSAGEVAFYRSPMVDPCNVELAKDKAWRAQLKDELRVEVHSDDAAQMLANKKHVVGAYSVLWVLLAFAVALLGLRQHRLAREIAALERTVAKAAGE